MKQRPRIYYTESQKALMWERWRKGEYLQRIAQLFDRNHSSMLAGLGRDDGRIVGHQWLRRLDGRSGHKQHRGEQVG